MTNEPREWGISYGGFVNYYMDYAPHQEFPSVRGHLKSGVHFIRILPEHELGTPRGMTRSRLRQLIGQVILGDIWNHADKIEAFHSRHSGEWSNDSVAIAKAILFSVLDPELDAGCVLGHIFTHQIGDSTWGWIQRIIAGADWLAGEAGQRSIASAVSAGVGTEEEVRAILITRLAAMDGPVAIDYFMDKVPPLISVTQTGQAQYYANFPGFVAPADQEMPTSVFLRYAVTDDSSVALELHVGLSYVAVESLTGERWIRDGNALSLRATDAQGNVSIRTFRNSAGIITESEETLDEVE